jgi:nitrous oxidase accessory protein NosD
VSYTLRGRLETRLAGALVPALVAAGLSLGLREWWPLELAGLMVGVGLALDALVWHRLLPYQPGWAALPMGVVELWATLALAGRLELDAPFTAAVAFFVGSWLLAQVIGQAVLPLVRLSYPEDGGELGGAGLVLGAAAPVALAAVLGVAWATQPPLVRLDAGVHEGPLVLDRPQRLVGEDGAVVRGGIVVRSDDVTITNVTVFGGETGIEIRDSERVRLERVRIGAATQDGIAARQSSVSIRDCVVDVPAGAQGIDLSFAMHLPPSSVRRCTVRGGNEGIVTNLANAEISDNDVSGTSVRAISMTEMSMGSIDDNRVEGALGIGIFCGDESHCEIEDNAVAGTRADPNGGRSRAGWDVVAHYKAHATLRGNTLGRGSASFVGASLEHR